MGGLVILIAHFKGLVSERSATTLKDIQRLFQESTENDVRNRRAGSFFLSRGVGDLYHRNLKAGDIDNVLSREAERARRQWSPAT